MRHRELSSLNSMVYTDTAACFDRPIRRNNPVNLMQFASIPASVIVLLVLIELLAVVIISDQEPTVVGEQR